MWKVCLEKAEVTPMRWTRISLIGDGYAGSLFDDCLGVGPEDNGVGGAFYSLQSSSIKKKTQKKAD